MLDLNGDSNEPDLLEREGAVQVRLPSSPVLVRLWLATALAVPHPDLTLTLVRNDFLPLNVVINVKTKSIPDINYFNKGSIYWSVGGLLN